MNEVAVESTGTGDMAADESAAQPDASTPGASSESSVLGVIQIRTEFMNGRRRLSANFSSASGEVSTTTTEETSGACRLLTVPGALPASGDSAPVTAPSAGRITFSAEDSDDPERSYLGELVPDQEGLYSAVSYSPGPLRGNEMARVVATGAEVGAFDLSFQMPVSLLLTLPVDEDGDGLVSIAREGSGILQWERGVAGVTFLVQGFDPETRQQISCAFPSEEGEGVIPAEILQSFSGDELNFYTFADQSLAVGKSRVLILSGRDVLNRDRNVSLQGRIE